MDENKVAASLEDFAESSEKNLSALEEKLSRAEDDLRLARASRDSAEKLMHEAARIRETIFGLRAQALDIPEWTIEKSETTGAPHVPILVTSDFQWGEVISAANMDGVNSFDVATAEERYRRLIDRTIDISFEHLPKNRYSGLIYLRLGDGVSGDIHQELRETNELGGVEAVRSLVRSETWGLRKLADAFGRVFVVSVPGNHGRTSLKPPTKKIAETNLDTISAWWLEDKLRDDARFSWKTPDSTDALFELHGRLYLATHGDNIGSRGGQGFVGPAATILRGMKKTVDEYARRGDMIAKMFVGHFHTAYDLGYGWSNGSLPGYSEFARVNRMTPEPPIQWLIYFHPKWGATSQWKILLESEAGRIAREEAFR
jgi:hypothetical protein